VVFYNMRIPVRLALNALCGVRVLGEERIPLSGGLIVASNHTSLADPVFLQMFSPRPLTYMMTSRYYYRPGLQQLCWFWGVVVVKQQGMNREAIRAAAEVLRRGGVIGIFPEGRLSRDGLVHEARPGIALLAQHARVPILPVGLAGVARILPPDTWTLHRAPIRICFGDLISPEGLSRDELTERVTRALRACAEEARRITNGTNARSIV
jgi:1-acyl-sn-glycerol-3-phosphate acyltransferase